MDDRMQYTFEKKILKSINKILKCVQKKYRTEGLCLNNFCDIWKKFASISENFLGPIWE